MKKFSRKKTPTEYDINDRDSLSALEQRAKFKYRDRYVGKESKTFRPIFKKPVFLTLQRKYAHPPLKIAQIAILGKHGLGVIATEDISLSKSQKIKNLGIYWGELLHEGIEGSPYVFVVSRYEVDALRYGNWTRFVNHSKGNYNVIACQKTCVIGKIRLPYMVYALVKNVKAGEQLLVDYGPEYDFDKKYQLFLNPSNNSLSMTALFDLNKQYYRPIQGKLLIACKEIMPDNIAFFGATLYMQVLTKPHQNKKYPYNSISTELPILAADKRGHILADNLQSGITPLMLAAYMGNFSGLQILVDDYNANIEQQNIRNGYTVLFYAIKSKCKSRIKNQMVQFLLDANITLSIQDIDGLTILHLAVKQRDMRLLKIFFSNRKIKSEIIETLDILDRENLCPITYAISCGEIKLAEYLLNIFQKYYRESLFCSDRNEWFIPVITKIMSNYPYLNRSKMFGLLMKHGLANNIKALNALIPVLTKNGCMIQFKQMTPFPQIRISFSSHSQQDYRLKRSVFNRLNKK